MSLWILAPIGVAVVMVWHEWKQRRLPWPGEARSKTFTCEACGSGPWDVAWDPHEQPVMGRRGGRICPNCSGAS